MVGKCTLNYISSASATISNDMATVTVSGFACEETYFIVAGGISINNGATEHTLVGPRFLGMDYYIASSCPVMVTMSSLSGERATVYMCG